MVVHLVLFRPKPGLGEEARRALRNALTEGARRIPSVRRFRVGRYLEEAPSYVQTGFPSFPYCGIVEFDDREGLAAYLGHPAHAELGRLFNETLEGALIYDFEVRDAAEGVAWMEDGSPPKKNA